MDVDFDTDSEGDATFGKYLLSDSFEARHTGQLEGEAIAHLWGRLGILLQRGNAAILGNRVPNFPQAEVDGIE